MANSKKSKKENGEMSEMKIRKILTRMFLASGQIDNLDDFISECLSDGCDVCGDKCTCHVYSWDEVFYKMNHLIYLRDEYFDLEEMCALIRRRAVQMHRLIDDVSGYADSIVAISTSA